MVSIAAEVEAKNGVLTSRTARSGTTGKETGYTLKLYLNPKLLRRGRLHAKELKGPKRA